MPDNLKTLPDGTVIRDQVIGNMRLCYNPECRYGHIDGKNWCAKCGWTKDGPPRLSKTLLNIIDPPPLKAKAKDIEEPRDMNKTERKYSLHLEQERLSGRILRWDFEAIRLRVNDNCWWRPDFLVVDCDGFIELHDTKAFWKSKGRAHIEDDALVKMQAIAASLPHFVVKAVWLHEGVWKTRVF